MTSIDTLDEERINSILYRLESEALDELAVVVAKLVELGFNESTITSEVRNLFSNAEAHEASVKHMSDRVLQSNPRVFHA